MVVAVSFAMISSVIMISSAIVFAESVLAVISAIVVPAFPVKVAIAVEMTIALEMPIAIDSAEISVVAIPPVEVMLLTEPVIALEVMESAVIIPVVIPEVMEVLAGKVSISRAVPATIEHRLHVVETIPRASANEHAVNKPLWAPVTVRCAAERIVRIVSVRACRRNVVVAVVGPDMDTDRNLGRRRRRRQRDKYTQQREIFEMSHDHLQPVAEIVSDWRLLRAVRAFQLGEHPTTLKNPGRRKSSAHA